MDSKISSLRLPSNHLASSLHPYLFLRDIYAKNPRGTYFLVVANELEAQDYQEDLVVLGDLLGINLPGIEVLPDEDSAGRCWVLTQLIRGRAQIMIATSYGVDKPTVSKKTLTDQCFAIAVDQRIGRDELANKLIAAGFKHVDFVESVGELAWRGQVLDVFSLGTGNALRVLFEFDRVESIRFFDVASQESLDPVIRADIVGVKETPEVSVLEVAGKGVRVVSSSEEMAESNLAFNPVYQGNLNIFLKDAQKVQDQSYEIKVVASTPGEAERFRELLEGNAQAKDLNFHQHFGHLSRGIRDDAKKLWIVTTGEIFARVGTRLARAPVKKQKPRLSKSYFERVARNF